MYSRNYSTSANNRIPPDYSGTSLKKDPEEEVKVIEASVEPPESQPAAETINTRYRINHNNNSNHARVPLMDFPVSNQNYDTAVPEEFYDTEEFKEFEAQPVIGKPVQEKPSSIFTKFKADDILLAGLIIVLLGCENIDPKLLLILCALLFIGL